MIGNRYEVWVKAKTAKGEGESTRHLFTNTKVNSKLLHYVLTHTGELYITYELMDV